MCVSSVFRSCSFVALLYLSVDLLHSVVTVICHELNDEMIKKFIHRSIRKENTDGDPNNKTSFIWMAEGNKCLPSLFCCFTPAVISAAT